ncbi:hypothetical protein [Streptomyces monashensis]|uniref:Uncharacterized protein n=1 Tax=Streptomyces monashensis TaxID=1678012 RepID=A0A1S2PF48_9ACTN|nr:hypothetical protein [Streptomyces monashensis]OIJ92277.1 hypothetical protein BIV23_38655 [Streptomyces monashensis]
MRNRLALALVVFFIPLWLSLAYTVSAKTPVPFFLRAADRTITVDGNILIQLTGALHSLALIIGFMMFLATSQSAEFDSRHGRVTPSKSAVIRALAILASVLSLHWPSWPW